MSRFTLVLSAILALMHKKTLKPLDFGIDVDVEYKI